MAYAFNDGLDNWDTWLATGKAARALGISADTLKRYALRDEILIEGVHWRRGLYPNSPWAWNITACEEAMRWRGRLAGSGSNLKPPARIAANNSPKDRLKQPRTESEPSFSSAQQQQIMTISPPTVR